MIAIFSIDRTFQAEKRGEEPSEMDYANAYMTLVTALAAIADVYLLKKEINFVGNVRIASILAGLDAGFQIFAMFYLYTTFELGSLDSVTCGVVFLFASDVILDNLTDAFFDLLYGQSWYS